MAKMSKDTNGNFKLEVTPNEITEEHILHTRKKPVTSEINVSYKIPLYKGNYSQPVVYINPSVTVSRQPYSSSYGLGRYYFTANSVSKTFNASSVLPLYQWYNEDCVVNYQVPYTEKTFKSNWQHTAPNPTGEAQSEQINITNGMSISKSYKNKAIYEDIGNTSVGTITKNGTVSITTNITSGSRGGSSYILLYKTRTTVLSIDGTTQAQYENTTSNSGSPQHPPTDPPDPTMPSFYLKAEDLSDWYELDSSKFDNNFTGVYYLPYFDGYPAIDTYFGTVGANPYFWSIENGGDGSLSTGDQFILYPKEDTGKWGFYNPVNGTTGTCTSWKIRWKKSIGIGTTGSCPFLVRVSINLIEP